MSEKLFIIATLRHESLFGENWAMFWAKDGSGYTADPYTAQRYKESEIGPYGKDSRNDAGDIPLPVEALDISPEYRDQEAGVIRLMEKGYINKKFKSIYFHNNDSD
jgi:hypothetical protein